jgi:hypothetical protein
MLASPKLWLALLAGWCAVTQSAAPGTGFPPVPEEGQIPAFLLPPPDRQWPEPSAADSPSSSYSNCTSTLINQVLGHVSKNLPYGKTAWSTFRHANACRKSRTGQFKRAVRCARQVCGYLPENRYCTLLRVGWVFSQCLPWAGCGHLFSVAKPMTPR